MIRVLPTILCERSSCKIIIISSPNSFKCAFFFSFLVVFSSLPSLSLSSLGRPNSSQGFYGAKADVLIYCGHPSPALIHHRGRLLGDRGGSCLLFELSRGAVSQRRQVRGISDAQLSQPIINQRREER